MELSRFLSTLFYSCTLENINRSVRLRSRASPFSSCPLLSELFFSRLSREMTSRFSAPEIPITRMRIMQMYTRAISAYTHAHTRARARARTPPRVRARGVNRCVSRCCRSWIVRLPTTAFCLDLLYWSTVVALLAVATADRRFLPPYYRPIIACYCAINVINATRAPHTHTHTRARARARTHGARVLYFHFHERALFLPLALARRS